MKIPAANRVMDLAELERPSFRKKESIDCSFMEV